MGDDLPKKKLRHVKTHVQHFFVLDDGETLEELATDPQHPSAFISAEHWPRYSGETFPEVMKDLERAANEGSAD